MAEHETNLILDWQRALLEDARRDLARTAREQRVAEQRAQAVPRTTADRQAHLVEEAKQAAAQAAAKRKDAAERMRRETAQLREDLNAHLPDTPEQEIARLAADRPIVLLPVRIETRFRGKTLLVRIYPDDIFAESHEAELTDQEVIDGERFWCDAWPGETAERSAWKVLVDTIGAPRAAWIARTLTPTNIATERPTKPPVFPSPERRATSWTRAAEARLLPDRWLVLCYRDGTEVHRVSGAAILEPLALTMAPTADASDASPLTEDGLAIDKEARWTVDFTAAEQAGMALRIPLSEKDCISGFDRILVLGVKSSLTPERGALELENLLTQHRFDRGVALVPQGTPTNNSAAGQTDFPVKDPDGGITFRLERTGLKVKPDQDGGRLMAALGLPISAANHISGADRDSDRTAAAMARALWPTTLGYFLEQLMAPEFSPDAISATQHHFTGYVRGRGPLPAFRVGNTPYGVLPVSTLAHWQPTNRKDPLDHELPQALKQLLGLWFERIGDVPRVGRTNDPDADLLAVLGMDASTREARIRSVVGQDIQWNLFGLFGLDDAWQTWLDEGQALAARVFTRLGHPEWRPRIARFNFGKPWLFQHELVAAAPLSEQDGLVPNYIDWIARATVPELNAESLPEGMAVPTALFYRLLRHAVLLEYHDAAFQLLERYEFLSNAERLEAEFTGLPAKTRRPTRLERLAQPLPQVSGSAPLHRFLEDPNNAPLLRTLLPGGAVLNLRKALKILAPLPTAELDRLFGETLDVVSHRLDAWITSLASKRLTEMRQAKPYGCHLAAFGWVEELRPRPAATVEKLADGRLAMRQPDNGGYVHAPSMTHAATAAVLRNAYLSRSGPDQSRYAVDLSSAQVRLGRFILDAVREGQPLGAVLGYRVERGLHERLQDVWIAPLRARYPLVAKKSKDPADLKEPTEQIAARNVVDGLALRRAYQKNNIAWGKDGLPSGGAGQTAIEEELAALDAAAAAVSDLLLAESVFQLVKGSPSVAAATLDAMAQGTVRPPDPEIASQPRSGTPLTHRVAAILGTSAVTPLPTGWPGAGSTLRSAAEPGVDAWLGTLFGDPTQVSCRVELGPTAAPIGNTTVSLNELGLRPIDLLALARAQAQQNAAAARVEASELDRRIQDVAYSKLAIDSEVETRITYDLQAAADRLIDRSFADILEVARAVVAVLAKSRPLAPIDLVAEDQGGLAETADLLPHDAIGRATNLKDKVAILVNNQFGPALAAAVAAPESLIFDLTLLREQLREVAKAGVPAAYPLTSKGNDLKTRSDLIAQAKSTKEELDRRLAKAVDILTEANNPAHTADPAYRVRAATEVVSTLLGADMPFLPAFKPAASEELANALTHMSSPQFIADSPENREREIRRFEIICARVRPAVDAWRRQELLGTALGQSSALRVIAQLPYEANTRWVARSFPTEAERPKPGRTSILMYRVAEPAATDLWSGLLLDSWSELIPSTKEQTGVTFHYDDPGAEAPQTILIAVPPAAAEQWDLDALIATLHETLDLAKVRAVDSELLGKLGQLLPAIYLSDSTEEVTIRSRFDIVRRKEMQIKGVQTQE